MKHAELFFDPLDLQLNAVSAVDNCLSQLSESMHNLRRDLTKHTDTSSIPRREPFGSISPIQTHHLNMPIYQAHSTQTSPLSDTTASHHRHHQLFLEVPNAPARYSELSDPTSATSMTSVASSRFKSPTSPVSPFQAMNLSEPSIGSKIARKKSHTRISNSVDEGQSSKSQSLATTPMYHRPTASVSSIATTPGPSMTSPSSLPSTCTPRGGGCCSNDDSPADGNLERERPSMMTRSREGRDPEMNSGTRRLLEHQQHQEQQQQHQQHFLAAQQQSMQMLSQANHHINHAAYLAQQQQRHQQQQYLLQQQQHHQPHHLLQQRQPQPHQQQPSFMEQLHSPSELPSPLPAEHAKPFNHQSTNQASDYPQIHLDETKCCLGVFECDHQGNILCGNN